MARRLPRKYPGVRTRVKLVVSVNGRDPQSGLEFNDPNEPKSAPPLVHSEYMGLRGWRSPICDLKLDRVFIGSCTNARIEDLRAAAKAVNGHKVAGHVNAMVVPGSGLVKQQAEKEGLDRISQRSRLRMGAVGLVAGMCLVQ